MLPLLKYMYGRSALLAKTVLAQRSQGSEVYTSGCVSPCSILAPCALAVLFLGRFYYSCVEKDRLGCTARKVVDRRASAARGDYSSDTVTIQGTHCHAPGSQRHQGRKRRHSSAIMQALRQATAAAAAAAARSDPGAPTPEAGSEAEVSSPRSIKASKGQKCNEGQSLSTSTCREEERTGEREDHDEQYDSDALLDELYWDPESDDGQGSGLFGATSGIPLPLSISLDSTLSDEPLDRASLDLAGLEKLGSQDLSDLLGLLTPRGTAPTPVVDSPVVSLDTTDLKGAHDKLPAEPKDEPRLPAELPQAVVKRKSCCSSDVAPEVPASCASCEQNQKPRDPCRDLPQQSATPPETPASAGAHPTDSLSGRSEAAGVCARMVEEETERAQLSLPGTPEGVIQRGRVQAQKDGSCQEEVSSESSLEKAIWRASSAADTLAMCSKILGKGMGINELLSSGLGPLVLDVLDAISLVLGSEQAEKVLLAIMQSPTGQEGSSTRTDI